MPALNDMSPEEEALFAQHGVPSAGAGGEPVVEEQGEEGQQQGQQPNADQGQQGQQGQQTNDDQGQQSQAQGEPAPGELGSRRRADGTFKSMEELEADRVALAAQQGGQQPQGQGGQQPQGQQEQQMVPLAALHEARARAAQAAQQSQILMTRMNAILTSQQGQQPQGEQMPDLATDPAGYIVALERRLQAFEETRQQEAEYRQIDMALEQDEQMFSLQVPDYDQASDYYVQSRARELANFYPPQEIQRILMNEARSIAQQAWQRGTSAGQMVYGLAQARGYVPGQQGQQNQPYGQQPQGQQGQRGQQPQNQQRGPTPQAQVASIAKGQQASRSLSGGGTGGGAEQLNAEALLKMSDDEFERYLRLGEKGADARFAAIG